jgi:RimJ/RimL family protein N-acetyltransferase
MSPRSSIRRVGRDAQWKTAEDDGRTMGRGGSLVAEPGRRYEDVQLRDVADADLGVFFEHQRDPEASRMALSAILSRRDFQALWAEMRREPAVVARTIVVGDEAAGGITSWERWGRREVGYWVGRRHWGHGVATTALALFLCQVTVRPLYAYVPEHNAASMRVLEKCGFRSSDDHGDHSDRNELTLVQYMLDY